MKNNQSKANTPKVLSNKKKKKPVAKPSIIQKWSGKAKQDLIQYLIELVLVEKKSHQSLLKMLQDAPYSFSQRHSYQLIKTARESITNQYKEWNVNVFEEVLADLAQQKEIAMKNKDRRLVLEITKEENKLKGLYVEKQEVKTEMNIKFNFGVDEEPEE